jgi:hypothetical protein
MHRYEDRTPRTVAAFGFADLVAFEQYVNRPMGNGRAFNTLLSRLV